MKKDKILLLPAIIKRMEDKIIAAEDDEANQ